MLEVLDDLNFDGDQAAEEKARLDRDVFSAIFQK